MARTALPRSLRTLVAAAIVSIAGLGGCSAQPTPQKAAPAAEAKADEAKAGEAKADEAKAAKTPPPLSEEDLALIAADPKDLTPEMRRKRAYARRRQIMQNPDSPTARALDDLAEAHQAGEIDVERRDGVWFSTPGTKPDNGRPPAGYRADGDAADTAPPADDGAAPDAPAKDSPSAP